uniref:Protein N-terminal asparagine amidohydrolase n=1 Tax=Plectus sambesii TaxID=2011161 RepID=A0A914URZ4_9BILA
MPLTFADETEELPASAALDQRHLLATVYAKYKDIAAKFYNQDYVTLSETDGLLYIHQNEFAIAYANDERTLWLGSGDATTCHIVILRQKETGATLLSHVDSSADERMIARFVSSMRKAVTQFGEYTKPWRFDLWLFGGFTDAKGYSSETSSLLLAEFHKASISIDLQVACITKLNTAMRDGQPVPRITGVAICLKSGQVVPAIFADRGPDLPLRMTSCTEGMRNVYDYERSVMSIQPFLYWPISRAGRLLSMSDEWFLQNLSTSPHCEPADFVANMRASIQFAIDNPSPEKLFNGRPREYQRDNQTGRWKMID